MTLEDKCRFSLSIGNDKIRHQCYLCIWSDYQCPDYREEPRQLELPLRYSELARNKD